MLRVLALAFTCSHFSGCRPRVALVAERAQPVAMVEPRVPEPIEEVTDPRLLKLSIEGVELPATVEPGIRVTLRNVTWDRTLWVKGSVGVQVAPPIQSDVWLDVEGGPPRRTDRVCSHCRGSSENPSLAYTRLTPQAEISIVTVIYCSPLAPGHYLVTGHYQDSRWQVAPPPRGAAWFAGELLSETVDLEVVGPAGSR